MRFVIGDVLICVDLHPGIYAGGDDSAIGKTYLSKLLNAGMAVGGTEYLALTYFDGISDDTVVSQITKSSYSFIMLDRLDLYLTDKIASVLADIRKDSCIFVDLKNWNRTKVFCPVLAEIEFTRKGIRLYESNDV